jgi:hypothetical protein
MNEGAVAAGSGGHVRPPGERENPARVGEGLLDPDVAERHGDGASPRWL